MSRVVQGLKELRLRNWDGLPIRGDALAEASRDTPGRGGKLIIPAFAVGGVGERLHWVRHLEHAQPAIGR